MLSSMHLHICPYIREMTWKKVINEAFKLSKLIAFGKESEMGRKVYGGRNKMRLAFFLTFYIFDFYEIFRNENVLLRFLLKTEKVTFSSSLPYFPFCLWCFKWHDLPHATKTWSMKARGRWFLYLLLLLLPNRVHLQFCIPNPICFNCGSPCRLFLLEFEFPSPS